MFHYFVVVFICKGIVKRSSEDEILYINLTLVWHLKVKSSGGWPTYICFLNTYQCLGWTVYRKKKLGEWRVLFFCLNTGTWWSVTWMNMKSNMWWQKNFEECVFRRYIAEMLSVEKIILSPDIGNRKPNLYFAVTILYNVLAEYTCFATAQKKK